MQTSYPTHQCTAKTGPHDHARPGYKRLILGLAYHGRYFNGWYATPGLPSLQNTLVASFEKLWGLHLDPLRDLAVAGRTDAGVHGYGQVVHIDHPETVLATVPPKGIQAALNSILGPGIRVLWCHTQSELGPVHPGPFHARFSASSRRYRYLIDTQTQVPVQAEYTWQNSSTLDLERMNIAALCFVGTHDFSACRASSCQAKTTTRTISQLELHLAYNGILAVDIEANGFLHNMVRIIVGTLVYAGQGKLETPQIQHAIQAGARDLLGPTAPPEGLWFLGPRYPDCYGIQPARWPQGFLGLEDQPQGLAADGPSRLGYA